MRHEKYQVDVMDAGLIVAIAASLVALLLGVTNLLVSRNNRRQTFQVQIEQKKQETLLVLQQVKLANLHQQSSLRQARRMAARFATLSPDEESQVDETMAFYDQIVPDVAKIIERLEDVVSNQDQGTLVEIEGLFGETNIMRLKTEASGTIAERLKEMLDNHPPNSQ